MVNVCCGDRVNRRAKRIQWGPVYSKRAIITVPGSTGYFPTLTATSCLLSSMLSFGRASATHFMELRNWKNYGLSSNESIWMSGADFVMCLENLTFSWDEVTGVILRVNSLESKKRLWVRLGLLLGRSGQPRCHARAEWGLRPFEDVRCGVKSAEWVKQIMFNNYNLPMITLWKGWQKLTRTKYINPFPSKRFPIDE